MESRFAADAVPAWIVENVMPQGATVDLDELVARIGIGQ